MELPRWDDCTKVLSVRITQAEHDALTQKVQKANQTKYRNKETASSIAREMIRYCLTHEVELK